MTVVHTVLFRFNADAKPDAISEACNRFMALKDKCIHPTSHKTYIKSLKAGKQNSTEGLHDGITHGFVLEFDSLEDRDYYVSKDPAHQDFVKSIGALVGKPIVVDFEDGVF